MIHLTVQQLSASLDGALTGPSLELVVRHLAACHDCRDRQARLAKHDDALRRLLAQDPTDLFLDDLTRRAEALATAISRGIPAPIMVTSVPLLHEEDPFAPVEPPPLPPRPELGKSGELAKEAGWGRIGVKPSASTQAPHSDPEEAQRMLEALASGNTDDFTELTAQGLQEQAEIDGPVFDLPAWIKDQSGSGPRNTGPREVPKLKLFFDDLDEHAAGMTREAVNEVFRRDSEPEDPASEDGSNAAASGEYEVPVIDPVPLDHAAYAPPGRTADSAAPEYGAQAPPDRNPHPVSGAYARPGTDAEHVPPDPHAYAPAGWHFEPAAPADPNQATWGPGAGDPVAPDSGVYPRPIVGDFGGYAPDSQPASERETGRAQGVDHVALLALATAGALLLILLVLQLAPAGPRPAAGTNGHGLTGIKLPRVQILRHGERQTDPVPATPRLHTAVTPPPVDEAVPPPATAKPGDGTDQNAPDDATSTDATDATTTDRGAASQPESEPATTAVTKKHAPAHGAVPAKSSTTQAPTAAATPVTAHAAPSTPAAAGDEADWPLLCGQVEDDAGQPITNARVSMAEISFATRTDARGRFCVSAPAGAHALFVERAGFTPQTVPVTISSSAMDVHIRLQPAR